MIESFLPDISEIVLLSPIAVVIALSVLARKRPAVAWLQPFSWKDGRSATQKQHSRRSVAAVAGSEMIALGLGAPAFYFAAAMTFFNEAPTGEMLVVSALSLSLIALGAKLHARGTQQKSNVVAFPVRPQADEPLNVKRVANG